MRARLGRIIWNIGRKIEGDRGSLWSAARSRAAGPPPRTASARIEELLAARARGGVHRHRKGPRPLQVRLQGMDHYASHHAQREDRSCCMPKPCPATPTTAIRLVPSSPISKGSNVPPCAAYMATRAIAATTIPTGSRSGSVVRSARSPKPSVANAPSRRRRAVIGYLKDDHRMRRNYLKGRNGDPSCSLPPATSACFSWMEELLLRVLLWILCRGLAPLRNAQGPLRNVLHGRLRRVPRNFRDCHTPCGYLHRYTGD